MLGAEIITTVLQASVKDWQDLDSAPVGSPLATVVKQFAKVAPISVPDLSNLASNNPALLRARLQDRLNVVSALI